MRLKSFNVVSCDVVLRQSRTRSAAGWVFGTEELWQTTSPWFSTAKTYAVQSAWV